MTTNPLIPALRAMLDQAKASGQSCTDTTRQAEEALRGVEPELDEAAKVAEKLIRLGKFRENIEFEFGEAPGMGLFTTAERPLAVVKTRLEEVRAILAAALRDFASAEVAKARKEWETPPVTPVAFSQLDEDSQALAYAERMVSVTPVGHIDIHGNGLGTVVDGGENAHGKADFLKRILARALAGYAFHRQSQQQPKPVEQPPAVEGDDPFASGTPFWRHVTAVEVFAEMRDQMRGTDAKHALQSYCRSAARAAEERGRREERERCARVALEVEERKLGCNCTACIKNDIIDAIRGGGK